MTSQNPEFKPFEKQLEGESVVVGEYNIEPVAQVTGWQLKATGETGEGAGAWLRVKPLEVNVRKGEDEPYLVPITNETQAAIKGIALSGLVIAALCSFIIIGVDIFRHSKEKKK